MGNKLENMRIVNDEVLYDTRDLIVLDGCAIDQLIQLSENNPRQRVRICTHKDTNCALHEMIIVHKKEAYVRPHKHINKVEAMHIIKGEMDYLIFDETGKLIDCYQMGEAGSGKCFYSKMRESFYHSMIIKSDVAVFHEITNGPFNPKETVFPEWAPEDGSELAIAFKEKMKCMVKDFRK